MNAGTHLKGRAGKIFIAGFIALSAFSVTGCDDKMIPVPPVNTNFDAPTFTPEPLVSKIPTEGKPEEVSYPAPAVTLNGEPVNG